MVDCGESDQMKKIGGKMDKSENPSFQLFLSYI